MYSLACRTAIADDSINVVCVHDLAPCYGKHQDWSVNAQMTAQLCRCVIAQRSIAALPGILACIVSC